MSREWVGHDRLWPVKFWPIHFWPKLALCCAGVACVVCCVCCVLRLLCVAFVCCVLCVLCVAFVVCCVCVLCVMCVVCVFCVCVFCVLLVLPLPFRQTPLPDPPPPGAETVFGQSILAKISDSGFIIREGPEGWRPEGLGGHKFRVFFHSPATFSFSSLLGVLTLNLVVFPRAGTLTCACLEFSGCRVKPRRNSGPPGFTRQPENSKRAHFSAPKPKFHEKTLRETKRAKMGRESEKSAKFWDPHSSGPHFFWVWPPPFGPSPLAKNGLAKTGLARIGQIRMAKNGLAQNGQTSGLTGFGCGILEWTVHAFPKNVAIERMAHQNRDLNKNSHCLERGIYPRMLERCGPCFNHFAHLLGNGPGHQCDHIARHNGSIPPLGCNMCKSHIVHNGLSASGNGRIPQCQQCWQCPSPPNWTIISARAPRLLGPDQFCPLQGQNTQDPEMDWPKLDWPWGRRCRGPGRGRSWGWADLRYGH